MYNFENNCFFTDPDTSKDEKKSQKSNSDSDENSENGSDSPSKQKKGRTNFNKADEKKLSEEEKQKKIRETHQKKFMNFPTNSGISGAVFKSKDLYYSNNASKETKFVEEIDNQSICTDVKNFMIGPVFGSQNKETPCAIIQFINKIPNSSEKGAESNKINQQDEAKFKAMQHLLGMCVENTNEMATTINVSFEVQDVMKKIHTWIEEEKDRSQQDDAEALFKGLTEHLNNIKLNHQTLTELRKTIVQPYQMNLK